MNTKNHDTLYIPTYVFLQSLDMIKSPYCQRKERETDKTPKVLNPKRKKS